jgi:small subunit ribosomal protein S15
MLDKKKKEKIIAKFKTHPNDTGSSEVQIAILTEEIKELTKHLKLHKKDFSSRRGLIKKVSQRKKLLRYLERENNEVFDKIIKELKINISKRKDRFEENLDLSLSKDNEKTESDKLSQAEADKK